MVSIYDIAKAAGMSAATVSRALADNDKISRSSRERIQRIADEMGYRPNLLARNFRQKSSSMIGLITDDVSDELSGMIAKGVEQALRDNGFSMLVRNVHHDLDNEQSAIDYFADMQMDGVILADSTLDSLAEVPSTKLPFVLINRFSSAEEPVSIVCTDDFAGGYDATDYLIKLNHHKIAYINGPEDWYSSIRRLNGYIDALKKNNIPFHSEYVKHGDWFEDSGYRLALELFRSEDPPTAVFAANDMMAVGVIDAARECGLRVPEDVSVMGYDDRTIAKYVRPRLTTIQLPMFEVGQMAGQVLCEMITTGHVPDGKSTRLLVRGNVIERETTAPLQG
ncbi:LacI family DNA-binding transcriptional regulator [Paenibacillus montanisoli]|uniref:LacI family transcriptional regulator n=1 Tax=Paenibacillus montanisoli TaxID=2081970 RepID=A0A328U3I3_9BACL|nr:LacI family DNA-binding transcriptional regulator [Paenibacillus montanisoli]RAP77368.1 LacI family transcriptional regulator [Paenibacillus montanisoli]